MGRWGVAYTGWRHRWKCLDCCQRSKSSSLEGKRRETKSSSKYFKVSPGWTEGKQDMINMKWGKMCNRKQQRSLKASLSGCYITLFQKDTIADIWLCMCVCARAWACVSVYLIVHSCALFKLLMFLSAFTYCTLWGSWRSLLCARCSVLSVCFVLCFFVPFFSFSVFFFFFQAVSPQLPHADSTDIHYSFYPPSPPSPPPILRGLKFPSL